MSAAVSLLPPGFESLEPFAADWAVAGAANRAERRHEGSAADRAAFYEAAKARLAEALAYLDNKPLKHLDEKEQRLMNLMLSLAHISIAVEVHGPDEPKHAEFRRYLRITRASADAP